MRNKVGVAVLVCLAAVVLVIPPAAQADDTTCIGVISGVHDNVIVPEGASCLIEGPGTVIKGNVTAFPRSDLLIQGGVDVGGNVTGLADSRVRINHTEVGGDVVGDKTNYLELNFTGNIVHGNIHVSGRGRVPDAEADLGVVICGAVLPNGNIEVEKMTVTFGIFVDNGFCSALLFVNNGSVKVEDNHVLPGARMSVGEAQLANGNLHVFKNTGPGLKEVNNNNVSKGDIQCYENDPPFVGGPNIGRAPNQPPPGRNQCFGTST